MQGMKKSTPLDLAAIAGSFCDDDYYSDDDMNPESCGSSREVVDEALLSAPLVRQAQRFRLPKFPETRLVSLPGLSDADYNLAALNTPLLPQNERPLQPIDFVFSVVASPSHFPPSDSDYLTGRALVYTWRDMSRVLPNEFSQSVQSNLRASFLKVRQHVRFNCWIDPTPDKLTSSASLRRDIKGGRIMFHYIGFGFPCLEGKNIYAVDVRNGCFVGYPLEQLFDCMKTPAWFVFDCSNAASTIPVLERAAEQRETANSGTADGFMGRGIDWRDWFCLCATDVGEELPSDPHLPRDFLTSCLLTPVTVAVVCHYVQYYRTTVVDDKFPLSILESPLLQEGSQLNNVLMTQLSAISDAIAADSLPPDLYRLLFRRESGTTVMFQRFLLAQYLLQTFQVHPQSVPALPDLSMHPLWQHWRATLDTTIAYTTSPQPSFATDLFERAKLSVRGFLDRGEESLVPRAYIAMLFHVPEDLKIRGEAFNVLAKYAATSEKARSVLASTALFEYVFSALMANDLSDDVFRSLCYLTISLLHSDPRFLNEIKRDFKVTDFPQRLFDERLPMETRTLVAVIIAAVLPHSEGIRVVAVAPAFLTSMQTLLETSDAPLTLWSLLVQRRMFDSFGSDLRTFFSLAMHIQVAAFVFHRYPEVRAAALATIPCFLLQNSDISNAQLFCLSMFCAVDASYLVRFNFVLFLSRFLTLYQDKITGKCPLTLVQHQSFREIVSTWIGGSYPFEKIISDFDLVLPLIDVMCRGPDYMSRLIPIALLLVDMLVDDPHPSVKQSATELKTFVQRQSGFRQRMRVSGNLSVPTLGDFALRSPTGSFPKQPWTVFNDLEPKSENEEHTAMSESGGDAMFKVCLRQIVAAGCEKYLSEGRKIEPATSLPYTPTSDMPSTKLVLHQKTKLATGDKPVKVAFHSRSLSLAIGTLGGKVTYCDEITHTTSVQSFGDRITSLDIVDWYNEPLVITGTEFGTAYLWSPSETTPRICFRADFPGKCGPMSQVVAVYQKNKIMTARGNYGTVRLWDLQTQRVIGEWSTGAKQAVTALACNPVDPNICMVGSHNGLIVSMDLRCSERNGPTNVDAPKANERILKICPYVDRTGTSFFAATSKGSVMMWETLDTLQILKNLQPITDFDVHSACPMTVVSQANSYPIICDFNMKTVHTIKGVGHGSVCSFHPALPLVAFANAAGELHEYELKTNK